VNILQVSITDVNGGAEKLALDLHHAYSLLGHKSLLIVGHRHGNQPNTIGLWDSQQSLAWLAYRAVRKLEYISGVQALGYWQFGNWWHKQKMQWDVIHLHNLHSSYFDIDVLPQVAAVAPLVQTLHDCWQFTGRCAHPFECTRWKTGCGKCPSLSLYPPASWDTTDYNWRRKRDIYYNTRPCLVTPSQWLKGKVNHSFLSNLRCEYICNGVDTQRFVPSDGKEARARLGLPQDKLILLYVANQGLNARTYKDPDLALGVLRDLVYGYSLTNIALVAVGGIAVIPEDLAPFVQQYEFTTGQLELYYQAADVLLYLSKADNCPLVMLEALASGLPVVCTNVGGCPELIEPGITGFSVPAGDKDAVVNTLLSTSRETWVEMRIRARAAAETKYSLQTMVSSYLALYADLAGQREEQV
jgi:glycosyltransferase involved in cell wall biosynthesis